MEIRERNGERLSLEGERFIASVSPSSGGQVVIRAKGGDTVLSDGAGDLSITEFLGAPYYSLTAQSWEVRKEIDSLILTTAWRSLRLEKRLSLGPEESYLKIEYAFLNAGPILVRPAFGVSIGLPSRPDLRWLVPSVGGLRSESLDKTGTERRYIRPEAPWCGVSLGGRNLAAMFPAGALDAVEVHHETEESRFTLTPLVYFIGLSPGCEARMSSVIHLDAPEPERMADLLAVHQGERTSDYGPAAPDRRAEAEAFVRDYQSGTSEADPGAAVLRRKLQERAERLAEGRNARLDLIDRLGRGEITIEQALAGLGKG